MNFIKILLSLLVVCSSAGCTQYAMNRAIDSWQNQKLSEVITAWGNPSEEIKIEGKNLFIWNSCDGKPVVQDNSKPFSMKDSNCCSRLLEADNNGKIVHGAWEGNDCPLLFTGWSK